MYLTGGQNFVSIANYHLGEAMPIFRLEKSEEDDMSKAELVIAQKTDLELEKHLENWLENSPHALVENESILWIGRQTSAKDEDGTIYSDLFGIDFQGNLVIAELKKGRTPRDIIAQILDYAAWAVGLSESKIREIAEAYFEARGVFEEKTFDDAFREVFDLPETDELPQLNGDLRLFIVAEEIPSRVARVCRFLRNSHGINVSCIDVSILETKSGEVVVSTETTVGDEDFAASKVQQQHASPPTRWSGDKPVKQVVWDAIQELTQGKTDVEFAIKEVTAIILKEDPNFKVGTVNGQITADCVNHPSRRHHSTTEDRYWRVSTGRYRLYDPEKDKMEDDK